MTYKENVCNKIDYKIGFMLKKFHVKKKGIKKDYNRFPNQI